MMVLYEVFLSSGKTLTLSDEMARDTQAQVMTLAEARAVGFQGIPEPPANRELRLVAVAKRDAQWLQQALEGNPDVVSFRVHDVD